MRVAIITPYYREEPDVLSRCITSVKEQTHAADHIMVADGNPNALAIGEATHHIVLPTPSGDYGDTPRAVGSIFAHSNGYDAFCWLDADNWLEPTHVEELVNIADQEMADVVTATRNLRRPDGSLLGLCTECDGKSFVDTNCYLIARPYMRLAATWVFKDKRNAVIGDRYIWAAAQASTQRIAHNPTPTVNYTTVIASHYLERRENPPENARWIIQNPTTQMFENHLYWDVMNRQRA